MVNDNGFVGSSVRTERFAPDGPPSGPHEFGSILIVADEFAVGAVAEVPEDVGGD